MADHTTIGLGASAARLELCKHMRNAREIPVSDFMTYFMPPSPVNVDLLTKKLAQHSRVMVPGLDFTYEAPLSTSSNAPRWEAYTKAPEACSASHENEKDVFADLENIAEQIVECCREIDPRLQQTNELRSNGTKTLPGHIYTSAQPDGIRVLFGMKPSWLSVTLSEEYKLKASDALDNYQKNVWNMFQNMRCDFRRRFVFGVTIHNTSVRLWHMNRELTVMSKIFDMNTDYRTFADMHARFAFATMDQLGYDHSMTKLYPEMPKDERYRVQVAGEHYITTQVLANYAAEDGFGRCTRVFRAYKEGDDPSNDKYAIKDGWLERDRDLEVDVYNAIMTAIDSHDWSQYSAPPQDLVEYTEREWTGLAPVDFKQGVDVDRKQFFMPILKGERVKTRDGRDDDTRSVIARGYTVPFHDCELVGLTKGVTTADSPATSVRTSQRDGVKGDEKKAAEPSAPPGIFERPTDPRVHHRSVMLLATPLDKIQSVQQAFGTLSDATYGLFVLHCLTVHARDQLPAIFGSAYNIFSLDGRGVLGDFEYTKHASSTVHHAWRTGTPNFMAVEVMLGAFLFDRHVINNRAALLARMNLAVQRSAPEKKPWEYSSVHDLESIWWIALWLLFRHTLQLPFRVPPYDIEAHESKYSVLFPGRLVLGHPRFHHLQSEKTLFEAFEVLPPVCTSTVMVLGVIRNDLMDYYQRRDEDQPLHPAMWWMIGYILGNEGQKIGGDLIPFTFPRRPKLLETPPKEEVDEWDEEGTDIEVPPSPCPGPRSGTLRSLSTRDGSQSTEGDERLLVGVSMVAEVKKNKRSISEVIDEAPVQDEVDGSGEAHHKEKKRKQDI
ncbi:hypothetical protein EV714DRAFT_244853 [Schizophyllum commune]